MFVQIGMKEKMYKCVPLSIDNSVIITKPATGICGLFSYI